ncbi:F-box protein SKIP31-like [Camellia sinensis]|uniref:F-box protein SKIP31-like n=1 Tax=Camellia sinensis TaxID=4442 RepID=UPI00103676A2|nr:F-box protein SKIP31-like [Camellia sinensis]
MAAALDSPKYVPLPSGGGRSRPVSARKLAATLWEMNEVPSPRVGDNLEEKKAVKREMRVRERMGVPRSVHSGSLPPHLSDPSHSPISESRAEQYCMRWGLLPSTKKLQECAWKKLYIQISYVQMQAAKRSQTPLPSQVNDDRIILDKTLTDQVSIWKSSRGLTDKVVLDHDCSGETCTYYQIGDVFVCEKTG